MAMNRTEAYDLSLFDTQPITGTAVPKPRREAPVPAGNVIHLPEQESTAVPTAGAAPCARWDF